MAFPGALISETTIFSEEQNPIIEKDYPLPFEEVCRLEVALKIVKIYPNLATAGPKLVSVQTRGSTLEFLSFSLT